MRCLRHIVYGFLLFPFALPALACAVCVDTPQSTLADHLLSDTIAVLARPVANDPARFGVVEVLRGDPSDLNELPDIPYVVSAEQRHLLLEDPNAAELMTFTQSGGQPAGRNAGETWQRHMTVTPERRILIDEILEEGDDWSWGMTSDRERFDFFAAHINHDDRIVQNIALAEISRAPYGLIRTLADALPPDALRQRLQDLNELQYAPVTILLLGLSADSAARDHVRSQLDAALFYRWDRLDAWAVAGLEVDGETALVPIARALRSRRLHTTQRADLVLALTVTGSARPELRAAIAPLLRDAALKHPEHTAELAYTFYEWRDWSLTPAFEQMLARSDIDHATRYILAIVVAAAKFDVATER